MTYSIVMPMDTNRLDLWRISMKKYFEFGIPNGTEFIIPTRSTEVIQEVSNSLWKDYCKVVFYSYEPGYNPSYALNLGTKNSKNINIIITSPEVYPVTNVLEQLKDYNGKNIVCQVFDEGSPGVRSISLVNTSFRYFDPGMYFLAQFNKDDLYKINGWDNEFMKGYAWEDCDFGRRWNRARLNFEIKDDIIAQHQYHTRPETIPGGYEINRKKFEENNSRGVTYCENGINQI